SSGPDGGFIVSLLLHPTDANIVYAGTETNGVFKSTDGGSTWNQSGLVNRRIHAMVYAPGSTTTIFAGRAGYGGSIHKSTDSGATWIQTSVEDLPDVQSLAIHPANASLLYAGCSEGRIFKSTDGGVHWALAVHWPNAGDVRALVFHPTDPGIVYAGIEGGVFKSTDGGANWTALNSGLDDLGVSSLLIAPDAPTTLYAGTFSSGVYKSTNGGAAWQRMINGLTGWTVYSLAFAPNNSNVIYAGTNGGNRSFTSGSGLYKSTDGGATWNLTNLGIKPTSVYRLAVSPVNPNTVFAGTVGAGVYKSIDGGAAWTRASTGLRTANVRKFVAPPGSPGVIYSATLGGGVFKSADNGAQWTELNAGLTTLDVWSLAIDPGNAQALYAATQEGVFKSTNGGTSWSFLEGRGTTNGIAVAPGGIIYASEAHLLNRSTNGGATWTRIAEGVINNHIDGIVIDPANASIVYVSTNGGGLFKTTNGGATWSSINTGFDTSQILTVAIDPANSSVLYAGTTLGIYKSTNAGMIWAQTNNNMPVGYSQAIAFHPTRPGTIYTGNYGRVYESTDSGASWTMLGADRPEPALAAISMAVTANSPTAVLIGTEGTSAWRYAFSCLPITTQPISQAVCPGSSVSFSVATSESYVCYQWRKNGVALANNGNVSGATTANLTIANANASDVGAYDVALTSACGTTISQAATLAFNTPVISMQPADHEVLAGGTVIFVAEASGDPASTVRWEESTDGGASFDYPPTGNVSGATNTQLTLTQVTAAQNGNLYRAVFSNACGSATSRVARLIVPPLNVGTNFAGMDVSNRIWAMAATSTDLYVAGQFITIGGISANHVARYNFAAQTWSALGRGGGLTGNGVEWAHGNRSAMALAVVGDDVYVGGPIGGAYNDVGDGVPASGIARWNRMTNRWSPVGGGLSGDHTEVRALVVAGGNLYVGGRFDTAFNSGGSVSANNIACWNLAANTWSALGGAAGATGNGVNSPVNAIAVSGATIYAGGFFTVAYNSSAASVAASRVAAWNGAAWSALGGGVDNVVNALVVDGGSVYAGGAFNTAVNSGGGVTARGVARWNGAAWSSLPGGAADGPVSALAVLNGTLYVGGVIEIDNGGGIHRAYGMARWDGAQWASLGREAGGLSNGAYNGAASALATRGSTLYVGGLFTLASNGLTDHVAAANLVAWDGEAWSAVGNTLTGGNGVNGQILAMAALGNDVYAGGWFTKVGNLAVNRIARWNGATNTWSPLGAGLGARGNGIGSGDCANANCGGGSVGAVAVRGNEVYVGGGFDRVYNGDGSSIVARNIARWNSVTNTWSTVGQSSGGVLAMTIDGDDVYIGGYIGDLINPDGSVVHARGIARWSTVANRWSALGDGSDGNNNGVAGAVRGIAVKGSEVYVGGDFTTACSSAGACVNANYVARWNKNTGAWAALGSGSGPTGNGVRGGGGNLPGVTDVVVFGNDVYVCGGIDRAYDGNAGGLVVSAIAKWNGTAWSALGSGAGAAGQGLGGGVPLKMTMAVGQLYVLGFFVQQANNSETEHIAVKGVARWNGARWSAVGDGVVPSDDISGTGGYGAGIAATADKLYVGGFFSYLNGNIAANFGSLPLCQTLSIVPDTLAAGTAGAAYAPVSLSASGGLAPYSFSLQSGALPGGMSLSPQGVLSGTPAASGVFNFMVAVNDGANCQGAQNYSLTINCPAIAVAPASLLGGLVGAGYNQSVSASPAGTNYTFSLASGALPPGLALNEATGVISGAPSQTGTYNFRIAAAGWGACGGFRDYALTINKTTTITTLTASPNPAFVGQPVTLTAQVMASLPGAPLTGAVTFKDGATTLGNIALNANGAATLTITTLALGSHALTASYSETAMHLGSASAPLAQVINNTASGGNVTVQTTVGATGITINFAGVTGAGATNVTPIAPSAVPSLPASFAVFGDNLLAFEIQTTASYTAPVTICFNLPSVNDAVTFESLRVLHGENGVLVGRTFSNNFASRTICARVTSLSPFVIARTTQSLVGPGLAYPATSVVSDQKAGSVLIYNLYTSSTAAPNQQNTRISLTNTHPARRVAAHLFFIDGSTCAVSDASLCLSQNQTTSFLANDLDPGVTGYLIVVAVDEATGCPVNFNFLIGDEFVKLSSGHAANLSAESFAALEAGLPACDANATTALLRFDGASYNLAPRVLALSNIPDRASGNDALLVVNRFGGNLSVGASMLDALSGLLYNDQENGFSFAITPGGCQMRASLTNNFPRTAPRFEQIIPVGHSGWMKIFSSTDAAILGAAINFNQSAGTNSSAFNQGRNLHKLSLTSAASLTIPVFPPNC
ncbi:MAG: Ig-like domain repeat protein, partial [Acidobacteriota bacterium]